GEQAKLGREVGVDRSVVVEMVAAEIGEGGGAQGNAIEPALIEAVRGGFKGEVADAVLGQSGQGLMQGHGIGRGQRTVAGSTGFDDAEGAERGGGAAEAGKKLGGGKRPPRVVPRGGGGGEAGRARARGEGRPRAHP